MSLLHCCLTNLGTDLQSQAYVSCSPCYSLPIAQEIPPPKNLYIHIGNCIRMGTFLSIGLREFYFTTLFSVCELVSEAEKLLTLFFKKN